MKYVIIGNSAAGVGAVEGIRQVDKVGEITVISNEPYHTYSRPLISYLLLGKTTEAKMVTLTDGDSMPYDKLLVGTGSSAFVPPFEGLDTVRDSTTFMSMDDAKKLDKMLAADK